MAYSMLSLYLLELGASVAQVGLVFTVASLCRCCCRSWAAGCRYGRSAADDRSGQLYFCVRLPAVLPFAFLEWVMIGLCVEYVSGAVVGPSFSAYIAEQSPEGQRGRVFGLSTSIYMVVTVIGRAGGFLAYRAGFRPMLFVALIFYAAATAVRIWMGLAERFKP